MIVASITEAGLRGGSPDIWPGECRPRPDEGNCVFDIKEFHNSISERPEVPFPRIVPTHGIIALLSDVFHGCLLCNLWFWTKIDTQLYVTTAFGRHILLWLGIFQLFEKNFDREKRDIFQKNLQAAAAEPSYIILSGSRFGQRTETVVEQAPSPQAVSRLSTFPTPRVNSRKSLKALTNILCRCWCSVLRRHKCSNTGESGACLRAISASGFFQTRHCPVLIFIRKRLEAQTHTWLRALKGVPLCSQWEAVFCCSDGNWW